ncbi:MFS general substrate transporter [Glarea lozoyensis ATCC 20868]|uniref:MFS general substrate transporter n=1 Tax=Glarea lozoyensis (strain ATCC 20868 / MF5171) TaxID=1116229 RepID=S3DTU5_GLAL2|nr:MFS general substrate transporter [Glarea lozoyensis ATCC 20868]EPE35356.1 MFS general substrate transporter [Glarea lozoyensis ATCC 20868]
MSSDLKRGSSSKTVFVVTTITFVLATVFVVGRLISRFVILKNRTADDWCIILAWFIAFGLSFAIDFGTSKGLGRHDIDIPHDWLNALRQSEYAFTILYNPALMATKTSILIFYLRMSRNTQNILRIASYVTLGIVNVAGVVLTFMNAFQCSPIRAAYDPFVSGNTKCISIVTLYLCSAPVNIITDLAILVLPIPVLTGMRLPQRQKTVLVFTFALGIFVTIIDVVRIYYLQQAASDQIKAYDRLGTSVDFAYSAATAFLWSAVEVNVGIICACIPTMKPLIKRILPAMITDPLRTRGSKSDSSSSHINHSPHDRLPSIAEPIPAPEPAYSASPMPHMTDFGNSEQGAGNGQPHEMDMMDFLTTPDMVQSSMTRTHTARTTATDNTVYFGFVNMRRPKSMLKAKGWESFKYCTTVTVLFFLWGFSYGLLNTLNNQIARIAGQSVSQTVGLSAAYFGAYFLGAMTLGQYVLRNCGFKATFISGLCIYGTGTLMFWPSAVLTSFPGFIISNFVVGFGLSVLETAANPFIALCGPSSSSEFRLLMAQGVQGVGSILSQLLAEKALFNGIVSSPSLIDVQWTYLAIALFDVCLALLFYYMPLPEANDQDLQMQSDDLEVWHYDTIFSPKIRLIYFSIGAAVFAQFCYVAAQESMSVWIGQLLSELAPRGSATLSNDNVVLVGHTTFTAGRFLFGALCLIIRPRILLLVVFAGCIIFATLTMAVHTDANGISAFAIMLFFFEGPIFPMVFAIGLRGMGRRTKIAAAGLTAAAAGGSIFPFVMLAIQRLQHHTTQYSYCVVIALFAAGIFYPIYLNMAPKARNQVDPRPMVAGPPIQKIGRKLSIIVNKLGSVGNGKGSPGLPIVEHRERSRQRESLGSEVGSVE